jgi:hypothetical protein
LWILSERQICPDTTWGTKLAMLFAGLNAEWCQDFRDSLTDTLEKIVSRQPVTSAEKGEAVVAVAIKLIHKFLKSEKAAAACAMAAKVHLTAPAPTQHRIIQPSRQGPPGSQQGRGLPLSKRSFEERQKYYLNETEDQKAMRMRSRQGLKCASCHQIGHFAVDPECPNNKGYGVCKPATVAKVEHITWVDDDSE